MISWQLFSHKLRFSFFILTIFTIIQAGITLWVAKESKYHIEKGRIANILLSEFIDLGGNKQRLKVWLAQYLLTDTAQIEEKVELQEKMQKTLLRLNHYLQQDKIISQDRNDNITVLDEQTARLKTLEANILSLRSELDLISLSNRKEGKYGEIWTFMIQVFDNLEGRDLKRLINDAIEIQRTRANLAESSAARSILFFKNMVYLLTTLTLITALMLTYLILKSLKKPLEQLVLATNAMTMGELDHRIQEIDNSEFGLLAKQFNTMADEIEKSRQQDKSERIYIEKQVEQRTLELQSALSELEKSEQQRKSFLTSVGHELKTPATVIMGEAEVTLRGSIKKPEVYIETLKNILLTCKQLSLRIEDLLVLAKDEDEVFSIMETRYNGQDLDKNIKIMTEVYHQSSEYRFVLDLGLNDQIELNLDMKRIQQLLVIIIDNAIRYSPEKSPISIQTSYDDLYIHLNVTNTAYFINEINYDKLFQKYHRDEKAKLLRPDGLGVGLYIAKIILDAHGGKIKAVKQEDMHFSLQVSLLRNKV